MARVSASVEGMSVQEMRGVIRGVFRRVVRF